MDSTPMDAFHGTFYPPAPFSPGGSAPSPRSPAGSDGGSPGEKKKHTRSYQACAPCRQRKVKCDMGDVENPGMPPCARCRRERRDCVFDKQRRKRARDRSETVGVDNEYSTPPNGEHSEPRRHRSNPSTHSSNYQNSTNPFPRSNPSPPPEIAARADGEFKKEIHSGEEAFLSLVNAATHLAHNPNIHTSQPQAGGLSGQDHEDDSQPKFSEESKRDAARRHWARFRYVRSGLMTAAEAMAYVEYFYSNCMPFTPIAIPDYRDPATHQTLLEREPFLIMAILTIASRFMELNKGGATGQISRPQNIHHTIFKDTQRILTGIIYAQEQFGGGLTGGGKAKAKNSDPLHRYGLRSITTVEALLLLCEWAPRALHFPPEADIELITPLNPLEDDDEYDSENFPILNGDGQKRRESWLEPAWRCDTMIWMLLHNAKALALEIGLFEDRSEEELLQAANGLSPDEVHSYHVRKMKTRAIFWAFYVQTCGRLELIGKVPANYLESFNYGVADLRIRDAVQKRADMYEDGMHREIFPMIRANDALDTPEAAVWFFWQEITAIMKSGNQNMFPRKERTRELTRTGGYRKWIAVYAPLLNEWRNEFEKCQLIPEPMRTILLIEYEYVRIYIHSLPLQAFVERAIASTPSKQNLDTYAPNGGRNDSLAMNQGISPDDVRKWMQDDGPYVQTLVESCQHVLALIGESKIPAEKLKHFSVRVYFRIMASAVHLLKDYFIAVSDYCNMADPYAQSFVVGAYAENITRSFELLGKATDVLHNRIVDDVHIGRIFAEMIATVSAQIHKRLTRFQPSSGIGRSRAVSATPAVTQSPALGTAAGQPSISAAVDIANAFGNINGHSLTNGTDMDPFSTGWWANSHALINDVDEYDSSKTAMPPPRPFTESSTGDDGLGTPITSGMNPWITLDLHPLMTMAANGENYGVAHGHFGPTFENGGDLLDPFMPDIMPLNQQHMHGMPFMGQSGQRYNVSTGTHGSNGHNSHNGL